MSAFILRGHNRTTRPKVPLQVWPMKFPLSYIASKFSRDSTIVSSHIHCKRPKMQPPRTHKGESKMTYTTKASRAISTQCVRNSKKTRWSFALYAMY